MAISRLEQAAAALQDGQASMTSSLPACSPLRPAMGVAGDMWVDLLQPGAGECCRRVDLPAAWHQPAGWAAVLGSLGCQESWNQAVEKTVDAALQTPEQGSGNAPVPGIVLL